MAINFNSLPTEKPSMGTIIPKGHYVATIKKSEMKTPKDETKPKYFSAECDITDPISKQEMGKFWINLFESPASLVRWQLSQFIKALRLPIQGEFELSDLTKMVNGKSLEIDIMPEERKDGKAPQRSVVDISADCFYPISAANNTETEDIVGDVFSRPDEPTNNDEPRVMASY